jgi:hypothetical protein
MRLANCWRYKPSTPPAARMLLLVARKVQTGLVRRWTPPTLSEVLCAAVQKQIAARRQCFRAGETV